ncbi:fimbrial protein [Escherichia coli]|uniref:fimbrial protein n=1 Tax=Escherichia coli TaxID=562 RepID=UPI0015885901|nr:fimbrial protein [Escherichia coli]
MLARFIFTFSLNRCNIKRRLSKKKLYFFTGVFLLLISVDSFGVNINIKGEVKIPPCFINNGQNILVDFNRVDIRSLNESAISKKIEIPIQCSYYQGEPYILINGTVMDSQVNTLKTTGVNTEHLGVRLYQGGQVNETNLLNLNKAIRIQSGITNKNNSQGLLTLTAALWVDGKEALTPGQFSSTATIGLYYY